MKKSISAILVAALMLFAFTACEQQMPTYKVPTGLTISTTKTDYIVGEVLDPSTFSGVVRYSDGSSDNLTGSELSFAGLTAIAEGENTITVNYGGVTGKEATVVSATATVYGYKITDVVLGNLPTTVAQATSAGDAKQPLSADGVTVTVTYNGQTKELAAGSYALTLSANTTAVTKENEDGVNISANLDVLNGESLASNVKMTTGKIVVTAYVDDDPDKVFDASTITSIEVGYLDDDDEFATADQVVYYGDSTNIFAVQATDAKGNKQVLTSGYTIQVENGDLNTLEETDVVAILTENPKIKSEAYPVTPKNYVVSIVAEMAKDQTIADKTSTSDSSVASAVTVTATLAAPDALTSSKTKSLTADEYTFNAAFFQQPTTSYRVIYVGDEENPAKPVREAMMGTDYESF